MKTGMSATIATLSCWALVVSSLALTGCSGGDSGAGSGSDSGSSTTQTPTSSAAAQKRELVGTWLGVAYLDDELLEKKRATITDPQTLANFNALVATFESMFVGAEFASDGTFTIEAEVTPAGGERVVQATAGNWSIQTQSGDVIVVNWNEIKEDGSVETENKEYTFLDPTHFVWRPSVSPDLQDCEAMFVFERKDTSAASSSGVATQPSTTEVR